MPNRLLWILLLAMPMLAMANLPPLTQDPISSMTAAPAVQVYQSTEDETPASTQPAVAKPVTQKKAVATQAQQSQIQATQQIQDLEARLTQFTQSYLLAQQEAKQDLASLAQKSMTLQAEIEQLLTVMKSLSQQVDQIKAQTLMNQQQLDKLSHHSLVGDILVDTKGFLQNYNNILLILLILVLLMAWWLIHRLRKRKAKLKMDNAAHHEEDDTKNEYDFMGSAEGIPAQLDLARAYIAMENYVGAKAVLEQVLAKGDSLQQQQAKELLATIPK